MAVEMDSSGKSYIEVGTMPGERFRLTLVPADQAAYGVDSVRLQIRDESGHLRQGPEVPLTTVGAAFGAVVELMMV